MSANARNLVVLVLSTCVALIVALSIAILLSVVPPILPPPLVPHGVARFVAFFALGAEMPKLLTGKARWLWVLASPFVVTVYLLSRDSNLAVCEYSASFCLYSAVPILAPLVASLLGYASHVWFRRRKGNLDAA
jgi:hypothetical protein